MLRISLILFFYQRKVHKFYFANFMFIVESKIYFLLSDIFSVFQNSLVCAFSFEFFKVISQKLKDGRKYFIVFDLKFSFIEEVADLSS